LPLHFGLHFLARTPASPRNGVSTDPALSVPSSRVSPRREPVAVRERARASNRASSIALSSPRCRRRAAVSTRLGHRPRLVSQAMTPPQTP
jgi:hypothetical protein